MQIVLIDPSLFTWPYDLKLAKGLTEIGHSVQIFGRDTDLDLPNEDDLFLKRHFYPGLKARPIKKLPSGAQLVLKGLSHIESMARLLRRLRRGRPDVIHFQWIPLAAIDQHFISSFKRLAPTILTVHDSNPFNNHPSSRLQRVGALKVLHQFDHLFVHTRSAYDRVASYGVSQDKLSIVAHGLLVNAEDIPAPVAQHANDRVRILLFGHIKPYKGIDVLLRAVAQLPSDIRKSCVVKIVGRPDMPMNGIFSLVKELDLERNIEFDLRYVPESEVPHLLSQADIQVFPYREIDASGALMLAIAAGIPIVASRIGIFAEWLSEMGPGVTVEPDNPAGLAAALAPLIADADYRSAVGKKIADLRDSIPAWKEIALATEAVYQDVRRSRD